MQDNELPKNMGKKIVDALKQQDIENMANSSDDNLIDNFDENEDISLDNLDDDDSKETGSFDFGVNAKDYQPVFSVNKENIADDPDMKLSIENDEDVEEIESFVEDNFDVELEVIDGKQPVYSFIVGVE